MQTTVAQEDTLQVEPRTQLLQAGQGAEVAGCFVDVALQRKHLK
jgi:hypothetical protein